MVLYWIIFSLVKIKDRDYQKSRSQSPGNRFYGDHFTIAKKDRRSGGHALFFLKLVYGSKAVLNAYM